jgi:hypothetical protein
MRRSKGSHRIMVHGIEYRWRAAGNDGYILIAIWPLNNIGACIKGTFEYHETQIANADGSRSSLKNQIVVTNRIIRRIIEYSINEREYNPKAKTKALNLKVLDNLIRWDDTIRASDDGNEISEDK